MVEGHGPDEYLDVYRRATDRITAAVQWLAAALPGFLIITVLAGTVPDLVAGQGADLRTWLLFVLVVAALGGVIALAVWVLATTTLGWAPDVVAHHGDTGPGAVFGPAAGSFAADVDGDGFLRLYGYHTAAELFEELSAATPDGNRTLRAATTLVDFAVLRRLRRRLRLLVRWGPVLGIVAAVAWGALQAQLP